MCFVPPHPAKGFPGGASGKETTCQCRRHKRCGFDPCVRKIPWRRKCNPLQYSCLENPMDRGDWQATVHRVSKSQTWLKRQHAQHILLKSWNLSLRRDLVYLMFIQHLLNSSPTMVRYSIYHAICPSHIQYFNPLYSIPFQLGHPFE